MLNLTKPQKGIATFSDWLYAPNGHCYHSFFGLCQARKAEDMLGCKTGSGQADFVIVIGTDFPLIIAGCQFRSFFACDQMPIGSNTFEVF